MSNIIHFILGLTFIIFLSVIINKNPKKIQIRYIFQIFIVEITTSYFLLHAQIGLTIIKKISVIFNILLTFAKQGIDFVFGNMNEAKLAFFFLNVLCPITFISLLIGILKYMKILTFFIQTTGYCLSKINGMGKLTSCNALSSLIFGQSENFIMYKDIINNIPKYQIYIMATTAMSTTSMSIIGVYINILDPKYVITGTILNVFSTFIILSLSNSRPINKEQNYTHIFHYNKNNKNFFEIVTEYIYNGFKTAMVITAMLIGFIALINAIDEIFNILFHKTLQDILSYIFLPYIWTIGIPTHESTQVARIMATKLITNEFVAITELQKISETLSEKSIATLSVFLVSFANFSSIGIIIGAIKTLSKKQSKIISQHGFMLLYNATLINLLSATITGLMIY